MRGQLHLRERPAASKAKSQDQGLTQVYTTRHAGWGIMEKGQKGPRVPRALGRGC